MFWHVTKILFLWIVISVGIGMNLDPQNFDIYYDVLEMLQYINLIKEWRNLLFVIYLWNYGDYTTTIVVTAC